MADADARDRHEPVMVAESLRHLEPARGGCFVDCTLGLGGHAEAVLEAGASRLIGLDYDPEAIALARQRLARFGDRVDFVCTGYDRLEESLRELSVCKAAGILADLGLSSLQLGRSERGFSFQFDGPLDMRMGPSVSLTAAEVVNGYSEGDLEKILRDYGEERAARRVARALVDRRAERPIETTAELRSVVHGVLGERSGARRGRRGIDSATRTFQALRIEVNQELAGLRTLLDQAMSMLEDDGRLVVISYHSLEDRIVKHAFRSASIGQVDPVTGRARAETRLIELLTRKPERPTPDEVTFNPRSRSARLRAARRL